MTTAMLHLREGDVHKAAVCCSRAAGAYRGFERLCRAEGVTKQPAMLDDFEAQCGKVLAAFEPPIPAGQDPVRTLVRTVRKLPRRRKPPEPWRVIDALDALITAGHAGPDVDVDRRVVRDVAKMLGGRVLLHYAQGRYLTLRPQTEHTLSTWSIHRLTRATRVRARTVRSRPEFWRPEQRRPGALMSFPIGAGVACVARRRRFTGTESRAVRTVLRFLDAHRGGTRVPARQHRDGDPTGVRVPLAGEGLLGQSRAWKTVLSQVERVASSDCSLVLLGETGTGKERLARAVHAYSRRSQGPFVPVNCGAIPTDLVSSELFGHIRGAFTGASRARDGVFVQAHRGTLFLDEIADTPADMQVALLRVLEEHAVTPVGSARTRKIDVRLLCATHKDLEEEVAAGRFREDLFHRIHVVPIRLPALRERRGDMLLLADHLLARSSHACRLHPDALPVLNRYAWPGNIRELDHVLQAAALLVEGPEVTPEILEQILSSRQREKPPPPPERLGPRSSALIAALGTRWCSAPTLARMLGVSARTVNRELKHLIALGLVEAHGQARARRYRRGPGCRDLAP